MNKRGLVLAAACMVGASSAWAMPGLDVNGAGRFSGGGEESRGIRLTVDAGTAENDMEGNFLLGTGGTTVDLKDDLNIDGESSFRLGLLAQLGWFRLGAAMQDLNMEGTKTLTSTFVFDGTTYSVGGRVDTKIDTTYYRLDLGFRIWSGDTFELGFGLGVHVFDMDFQLDGDATAGGGAAAISEQEAFTAPIPALSLFGAFYPTPKLSLEPQFMVLITPDVSGVKGKIYDISLTGKYSVSEVFSFGARLGYMALNIEADTDIDGDAFVADFDLTAFQITGVVGLRF